MSKDHATQLVQTLVNKILTERVPIPVRIAEIPAMDYKSRSDAIDLEYMEGFLYLYDSHLMGESMVGDLFGVIYADGRLQALGRRCISQGSTQEFLEMGSPSKLYRYIEDDRVEIIVHVKIEYHTFNAPPGPVVKVTVYAGE